MPYISKIIVGEDVLDLTGDTVKKQFVLAPYTFHGNDGTPEVGECTFDLDTSSTTAEKAEVLEGEIFGAHGKLETGTMPNIGKQTVYISNVDTPVGIQYGFHDGSGSAAIDPVEASKLKNPQNIKAGVEIMGVRGQYSGEGATAEAKTVTPTFAEQTVLPTTADYLSQVTVNPIPVTKVINSTGGYTITVG